MFFASDSSVIYWFLLLPITWAFYYFAFKSRVKNLKKYGDINLVEKMTRTTSSGRQKLKAALILLVLFFIVIAISRPKWGTKVTMMKRKGIDIVIAVDVSTSMLAKDIVPNRIDRAKHEIAKFIDKLKGDRIGIVAFAGAAFVQCPITTDYGAAKMFLDVLDPGLIPVKGTVIGNALETASGAFPDQDNKYKIIILITDGEDHSGKAEKIAKKAAEEGIIIYCLGIGSGSGVPIPIGTNSSGVVYKKDRSGNIVLTSLDENLLQDIAITTNGKYFHSTGGALELERIYTAINEMEKKEMESKFVSHYNEQFMWPIGIALLLLILEFFISGRRKKKLHWTGRFQ